MRGLRQIAAEGTRTGLSMKQAEDVARHLIEAHPAGEFRLRIGHEPIEHLDSRGDCCHRTEQHLVDAREQIGVLIGGASEHHAIDMS